MEVLIRIKLASLLFELSCDIMIYLGLMGVASSANFAISTTTRETKSPCDFSQERHDSLSLRISQEQSKSA